MTQQSFPVSRSDEEWRARLTPQQYEVMRRHGTERPGSCALNHEKRTGVFSCAGCDQPLFDTQRKFESGTGWPSFFEPVPGALETTVDRSHGMVRTEVRSKAGDSHLGHVFPDGPADRGGLRYCINSASLRFIPRAEMEAEGYGAYLDQVEAPPARRP